MIPPEDVFEEEYVIWSTKLNAWWGQTSTYTSDFKQARHFTRDKAVAFCKARFNGQIEDMTSCFPIEVSVVEEVMSK